MMKIKKKENEKESENYDAILDRIESYRNGEALTDLEIKEFLIGNREGHLTNKQDEMANDLFIKHMDRFDKRKQLELEKKKTLEVHNEEGKLLYKRTPAQTWKPEQVEFIRKLRGVKTPKQIAREYNFNFASKGEARTDQSITSKLYRN